jgi:hypothetical protein
MSDTPKKPEGPSFQKNKPSIAKPTIASNPPKLPDFKVKKPSAGTTHAATSSNTGVIDKVNVPERHDNAGGREGGLLAKLSNKTKEAKFTPYKSDKIVKTPELSSSVKTFKGQSFDERAAAVEGSGSMDTPPVMERTRPVDKDGQPEGMPNAQTDYKKSGKYDTRLQKPHSLNMRYRIPSKLERLFSEEPQKLKKLANYVMEQIRLADTDRSEYLKRLAQWRQSWKDFESAGLDPAFDGAHDVHVPLTWAHIKAMSARIFQAVWRTSPRFSLKPRTKVPEIHKEDKENLLVWVQNDYANCQQGWGPTIRKDVLNFCGDGVSVTKQYWLRDVRKFTDVEETVKRPLELDEDGFPVVEEKEIEKEEVLWDCPVIEEVKLEDFRIIGRSRWDVDKADLIDHEQDYTKSELIKATRLGFFNEEAVKCVLKTEPGFAQSGSVTNATELKELDDYVSGFNQLGSRAGRPTYKIHECYLRYDIDDDGIDEDLVAWVEEHTNQVLRLTYLERVGPGGKRPFTIKLFTPEGKGLGELLYGLNNEIDYIHNQRLDYGTIQNLPFFFYRAASGLNPIELKLGPGMGIPVDDPQGDVMFPRLNGGTAYGFQEEAQVNSYINKIGIPEFAFASNTGQGATRTATGTAALVSELNANIDEHIEAYQDGFKRNLYILDLQCQDLLPLGLVIRVAGVDGKDIYKRFENREAIRFATDFELSANSINSNKAIERETAQMLLQQLANPIALQTGVTTQINLYNAYKNLLQKFDVKDIDAYITKPADAPDSMFNAKDELNMIIAGVKPPLLMKDRHDEKLAFFDEFEKSEDFSWLTEEHMPLYLEVRKHHEQMSAAIAAQAANPALQNGMMDLGLSAQLAAGGGQAANGPAQQQSDLGQAGGQMNPMTAP